MIKSFVACDCRSQSC